jgi:hypothetical protein
LSRTSCRRSRVFCGFPRPETPHVSFVLEYVRELRTNENNRELAEKRSRKIKSNPFPAMIRGSSRIILALRTHIGNVGGNAPQGAI